MSGTLKDIGEYIAGERGLMVAEWHIAFDELTVTVAAGDIVPFVEFLRDDPRLQFVNVVDVCGVDWPEREKRFDVVYHFLSPRQNARVRIKVQTDEATPVPSITSVFPGADWFEREAYDLYGILFTGHPTCAGCSPTTVEGYPMRKDPFDRVCRGPLRRRAQAAVYSQRLRRSSAISISSPWEGSDCAARDEGETRWQSAIGSRHRRGEDRWP